MMYSINVELYGTRMNPVLLRISLALTAVTLVTCTTPSPTGKPGDGTADRKAPPPRVKTDGTTEKQARSIAERVIREREGWADRAEYHPKRVPQGWSVTVLRVHFKPDGTRGYTPGGHRKILTDRQRNVLEYTRGR